MSLYQPTHLSRNSPKLQYKHSRTRLVFSLSCFCYAISFFIYGPLSDQISTPLLVIFGCIGTIFNLSISGFVQSFKLHLFIISLTVFFAASVPAALFAYTAKTIPNKQLPKKIGLIISASIVGMIFSRSFIAILTDNSSWQFAFMIYATLIFYTCLFIPYSIKNAANNHKLSIIQAYLNATQLLLHKTIIVFYW
ncbi:MFS transporter [Snodgrassella communis]|uniref:MFS transporter n=1 Tax=Snodgrassella communis TaxID=2946699 RepID=UPI000C1F92A0|nr:MFS transporter [Snodgrassella communis]